MICASVIIITITQCIIPMPPLGHMMVIHSRYDPALCADGYTINCDSDPTMFADGTAVLPESYNVTAACLPEWLGATITTAYGSWLCRDRGGMIRPYWSGYWNEWVIPVDVLSADPIPFNYELSEWSLNW